MSAHSRMAWTGEDPPRRVYDVVRQELVADSLPASPLAVMIAVKLGDKGIGRAIEVRCASVDRRDDLSWLQRMQGRGAVRLDVHVAETARAARDAADDLMKGAS